MRICFFNDIAVLGGGEIWVLKACRYLGSLNHQVSVICPYRSALHEACQKEGIDLFTYFHMEGVPFYEPLYHFLENRKIDILYCTIIGGFCEARVLATIVDRINSKRNDSRLTLILKTGLPPMEGLTPEYYGAHSGHSIQRLHVVSQDIKKNILAWTPGIPADFIRVMYEGVYLEYLCRDPAQKEEHRKLFNIPADYRVVTCLARLHVMKGQDNLLLAIPEVLGQYPRTRFLVAGEGEDRKRLEQLGRHLDIEDAVHFTGHIDDIRPLLNATDILCHPSLADGIPNSVVEAMAMSVPVVASSVGGIPEIIEDNVSGLLIPPHDVHAITAKLKLLLADDELRERLGQTARKKISQHFDIKKNLDMLVSSLEEELEALDRLTPGTLTPGSSRLDKPPVPSIPLPIPVLFIFSVIRTGGEETEIGILSRCLDREKFKISILSCFEVAESAPVLEKLAELDIPIDTTCYTLSRWEEKIAYIIEKIHREEIKVVVATQDTRIAYNVFRHLPPGQCRLIEHGGIVAEVKIIPKEFTARYVAVSAKIRDEAAKLMKQDGHAVFIPSMVDMEEFARQNRDELRQAFGFTPGTCVITFVGRLDPKKRVGHLLQAAGEILKDFPHCLFLIIGGCDALQATYASKLMEMAQPLLETKRLIFTGARGDIPALLSASDIFVLPAEGEGMSHVINEAGACGLAVVATDDGAAREQLDNGKGGLLIPTNRPDKLTQALRQLIRDQSLRTSLGNHLKEKVNREYSAHVLIPQWEALLWEVAEEAAGIPRLRMVKNDQALPFPKEIQVQTNTYCNGACIMCPHPVISKELSNGSMEESLYKEILSQCAGEPGLTRLEPFLMNEPFTDKRIIQWISLAKKTVPHACVTVTTNGALVTPEVSKELVSSGLDAIWFSFNGARPETYEKIMGIPFQVVKDNIDYLLSIRPPSLQVFVNMIETLHMMPEIEENIRYWQSRGLQAGTSPLVNRAGNVKNFDDLDYKSSSASQIRTCELPFYKMYILYNGDVVLCCMDWRRQVILGNVKEKSIRDIWQGEAYRHIRQLQVKVQAANLPLCSQCSYIRR